MEKDHKNEWERERESEKHLNDYDVLCCRLHRLHMNATSSSLRYDFFFSFLSFPSLFIFQTPRVEGRRKISLRKKSIIVCICVSKGIKRKSQQQSCIHFSIFFPGPSQENQKKKRKRQKKREREKKCEIKIILCLCFYMVRIIKIMYTYGIWYISWYTLPSPYNLSALLLMVLCVIFSDVLSFIFKYIIEICVYICSFCT